MQQIFIEAYCVTRFPKWDLRFRGASPGNDTVPRVLATLDTEVLAWKPTVVMLELGMSDASKGEERIPAFLGEVQQVVERIRQGGARPILVTPRPINDLSAPCAAQNAVLHKMADAIVGFAAKEHIACEDQFLALHDVWCRNLKSPNPVSLDGSVYGPAWVGQLSMAYAWLAAFDAPDLISSAMIDAGAGTYAATNCVIGNLKIEKDVVSFDRTDDCLPMPIPGYARDGLKLVPLSERLNRYTLRVVWPRTDRVPPSKWDVSIDNRKVVTVASEELSHGWNMSEVSVGPVAAQCENVFALIQKKDVIVSAYRETAKWKAPAWLKDPPEEVARRKQAELERLMKNAAAADAEIRAAAQPKPHHFVLAPAK